MSKILDVSNKLGEYLLQGNILTDEPCPNCSIPMLKAPTNVSTSQRLFCSQCPDVFQGNLQISHVQKLIFLRG